MRESAPGEGAQEKGLSLFGATIPWTKFRMRVGVKGMWKHRVLKIRRYVRLWWRAALRDTFAPIFDKGKFLHLLSLPIFLLLTSLVAGEDALEIELWNIGTTGTAVFLTVPIWFALNMILALFRVGKEESERGQWFDRRFVYHLPQLVFTTLIEPSDNGKFVGFTIDDAEPNALVKFKIRYDGGISKAQMVSSPKSFLLEWDFIRRDTQYGARIDKDRAATIIFYCPENSDPTIVSVSMLYWEI